MILEEDDPAIQITAKKLGMTSMLEVYKNIIPQYRIRELTDAEKQQAVSYHFFTNQTS